VEVADGELLHRQYKPTAKKHLLEGEQAQLRIAKIIQQMMLTNTNDYKSYYHVARKNLI
jgi:hypothetical protein